MLPGCEAVEVRLSNRTLFEAALAYTGASRELRSAVAQLLATASAASPLHPTARGKRWPSIRCALQGPQAKCHTRPMNQHNCVGAMACAQTVFDAGLASKALGSTRTP